MMKLEVERNMEIGDSLSNNSHSRRSGDYSGCTGKVNNNGEKSAANWNGAMKLKGGKISAFIFGEGIIAEDYSEELLSCCDILDCLVFTDRNKNFVTIKLTKEFLRRILKSHMHYIRDNKI